MVHITVSISICMRIAHVLQYAALRVHVLLFPCSCLRSGSKKRNYYLLFLVIKACAHGTQNMDVAFRSVSVCI